MERGEQLWREIYQHTHLHTHVLWKHSTQQPHPLPPNPLLQQITRHKRVAHIICNTQTYGEVLLKVKDKRAMYENTCAHTHHNNSMGFGFFLCVQSVFSLVHHSLSTQTTTWNGVLVHVCEWRCVCVYGYVHLMSMSEQRKEKKTIVLCVLCVFVHLQWCSKTKEQRDTSITPCTRNKKKKHICTHTHNAPLPTQRIHTPHTKEEVTVIWLFNRRLRLPIIAPHPLLHSNTSTHRGYAVYMLCIQHCSRAKKRAV